MTLHEVTALLDAEGIGARGGWLKMECWQPTGSFKIRGIGRLCETARRDGAKRLVSSSGGNAGMAAAWAGRRLGLAVTVVVPTTTPAHVVERLQKLGAGVQVAGSIWDEADAVARELAGEAGSFYVSPFDHPEIWAGHATLIDEVVARGVQPDGVVVSVGGGGLLCGIVEGMQRAGWTEVPVYAVETHGAASMAAALAADAPVTIDAITTLATTLGSRRVADRAVALAREQPVRSVLVSDHEAVTACARFLDTHRTLVEPACGASLAALAAGRIPAERPLIVVCGGSGVTRAQLETWETSCATEAVA